MGRTWFTEFARTADDLRLPVRLRGEGPDVVLLHGFTGTGHHDWIATGVADRLVDAGYRVVVPDLRGHGEADAPSDPGFYEPGRWTHDVATALAVADADRAALVGYSMGARVAARAALDVDGVWALVLGGMGTRMLEQGWRAPQVQLDAYLPASVHRVAAGPARRERERVERAGLSPAALGAIASVNRWVPAEELAGLRMPCLVVKGSADPNNGDHRALAAAIPGATAAEVPGGHWSALVDPPFIDRAVAFLGGHQP